MIAEAKKRFWWNNSSAVNIHLNALISLNAADVVDNINQPAYTLNRIIPGRRDVSNHVTTDQ